MLGNHLLPRKFAYFVIGTIIGNDIPSYLTNYWTLKLKKRLCNFGILSERQYDVKGYCKSRFRRDTLVSRKTAEQNKLMATSNKTNIWLDRVYIEGIERKALKAV